MIRVVILPVKFIPKLELLKQRVRQRSAIGLQPQRLKRWYVRMAHEVMRERGLVYGCENIRDRLHNGFGRIRPCVFFGGGELCDLICFMCRQNYCIALRLLFYRDDKLRDVCLFTMQRDQN